jgi:hypothetical protein
MVTNCSDISPLCFHSGFDFENQSKGEQLVAAVLSLLREPKAEQDAPSNVGQRPIVNSGFPPRRG